MKIVSRSLIAGAAVVALAACNDVENNEENTNLNDGTNDEMNVNENNDGNENNGNDENGEDNGMNDDMNEEADEEETVETGSFPVENVSYDDGVLTYEYEGTEGEVDADMMETEFGKEIAVPASMNDEVDQEGTHRIVHLEDEGELDGLFVSVREAFDYSEGALLTTQVDPERNAELQEVVKDTTGHINSFETVHLDDETPFHFYFHIEGDASEPGVFPESINDQDYEQFKFYEIVEEGYYYVDVMVPADRSDEAMGAGLAVAQTFSPEGATLDPEDQEEFAEDTLPDEE
ncbi:hypothetical protein [Salisediminibacterium selenitireducens]|uniref:Lipoprotein n=1 Tax=Bacillus selenitireducens (strain ATCC 700615 / DSM 15326 / MLS10) TaxID=439292 RepID=D6XYI6_BACIE|nr:hypothetical protein [Salisediminibacterium selenitireducens]ADI00255.1 hypothetical protein Bsel_2762 [[Bacillus] selenitireducens MLS10]